MAKLNFPHRLFIPHFAKTLACILKQFNITFLRPSQLETPGRAKASGHRPHPWRLRQPTETSIGPNIKCPVTLMKYFSCDKWGHHQSWKVLKMLIDQRNGVITPLTFLTVDSCFHGLSISPHQAVQLTSSYCVHSLTFVLWLPVTKCVLGWERNVFSVLECTVRQSRPPHPSPRRVAGWQSVHGRWTVGDTGAGETLWRWAGGCRYTLVLLPEQSGGKNTNGTEVKRSGT